MKKWKLQWGAWIALAIAFCIRKCESSDFAKHGLFWGGKPFVFAAITQNGVWESILDSNLNVTLPKPIVSVISYELAVEGLRGIDGSPLPREGTTDYLQVRCLIDGIPFRASSAMTGNYDVESRTPATVSSIFAFNLSAGSHDISLQWRKLGSRIEKWTTTQTGTNRGYSMIVHSDFKQVAYVHEVQDAYLYSPNQWSGLSRNLSFSLSTESTVTIRYSLVVQPQLLIFIKDRSVEFVTTRALVDGTAYTQSSETFGTNPWNPITSTVSGQFQLTMLAGNHTVLLQWKKSGSAFKGWASSPSTLDGFASSRNIIISVDKFTSPALFSHNRDILSNGNDWSVVGGRSLAFTLLKESAFVFTYGLPVTQFGNPNLDANVWSPLSQLDARLLIDGIAYTFAGTTLSAGSRRFEDLHGQLVLVLPAGPHAVALQWRSPNTIKWTTLNDIDGGFAHGETLLTFISSEDAQPTITAPIKLYGIKDTPIVFTNVSIADIDAVLAPGVNLLLTITIQDGTLFFPNDPILGNDIEIVHGLDNTTAILLDTVENINAALNGMQYLPRYLFYGEDTMVLSLNDLGNTGFDGPLFDTKTILLEVAFIDYPFTLDVPSRLYFASNTSSEFAVEPIVLSDVDSLTNFFRADLSVVCGMLSLESELVSNVTYLQGSAISQSISIFGLFTTIQAILKEVVYIPYTTCNSRVHPEIFTLTVVNSEVTSQTITKRTVIDYIRPKVQPLLRSPRYPLWQVNDIKPVFQAVGNTNESYKQSFLLPFGKELSSYNAIQPGVKANMSEIVLYSSSEMDYKLTVNFGDFNVAVQGSFYVILGLQLNISVSLGNAIPVDTQELGCSVNNVPFGFQLSETRSNGTCDVVWTQELDNHNAPVWIKLYYVTSDNEMVESNYAPLFVIKPVEVISVSPQAVLPASRSTITVTCSDPTLVTACVLGNDTVQVVSRDQDSVRCVVPLLFDNSTTLPVLLSYADGYMTETMVDLQILVQPMQTAATLIYDETSVGWIAELAGTWSSDTLDSIGVLSFNVANTTNTVDFIDEANNLFGFVSLSTEEVQACLLPFSPCFASVSFDSFTTNDVQIATQENDSNSTANSQSVADYGLFVVGDGFLNIFGISATSEFVNSSCLFDENSTSQLYQTSDGYFTCLLSSLAKTMKVAIIDQLGVELFSRNISIDTAPVVQAVSPTVIQPNTATKIVINTDTYEAKEIGIWHCVFNSFIINAVMEADNTVTCLSPPVVAGSVKLQVFYNFVGINASVSEILVSQRPELISLEPAYGVIGQETIIVITGSAFQLLPEQVYCQFGEAKATTKARVLDDNTVSCKVPKVEVAVRMDVLLATEDVIVARNSLLFEFIAQPILLSVEPNLVSRNMNTKLLIAGRDFPFSYPVFCKFDTITTTLAVALNSTMLLCDAPEDLSAGKVSFQLMVGTYVLPTVLFIKVAVPWHVKHVRHEEVFAGQMTKIKFRGPSKLEDGDNIVCFLDKNKCTTELISSSEVSCSCPTTTPGSSNLSLFVNDLEAEWAEDISQTISILLMPNIIRVHPMYIPIKESVLVVVDALDFEPVFAASDSTSVSCSFGNSGWSTAVIYNSNSLGCFTPLVRFPGSVSMALRFASNAVLQVSSEIQAVDLPKLLQLSSSAASAGGGKVIVITGTSFSPAWQYYCNFVDSAIVDGAWINSSSVHCFTPPNATVSQTILSLQVEGFADPLGSFPFDFVAAPVISGISPGKAPLSGNAIVNVSGVNFNEDGNYFCQFGNTTVSATQKSVTLLQCTCPSSIASAAVPFTISLDGVESSALADITFEYVPPVTLLEVYPSAVPIDGEVLLSIVGSGFNAMKSTLFCVFGDVMIPAQVQDDEMLYCVSPVVQSAGEAVLQLVLVDDFFALGELDFSFYVNPVILEVVPTVFSPHGGNEVIVSISDAVSMKMENVSCLFDDLSIIATSNGINQYWCQSPALIGSEIVFTLAINNIAVKNSRTFTILSTTGVSSISPSMVFNNYEDKTILTGVGFLASKSANCIFGNVISAATIVSDSAIECATPTLLGELSVSLLLDGQLFEPEQPVKLIVVQVPTFELVGSSSYPLNVISTVILQAKASFDIPNENVTCVIGNITSVANYNGSVGQFQCNIASITQVSTQTVSLIFPAGTVDTGINISFVESPLISSFSPLVIGQQTSAIISIHGDHFILFADSLTCVIGGQTSAAVVISDNLLECMTSALSVGNYSLSLYSQDNSISDNLELSVIDPGLVTSLDTIYDENKQQKVIVLTGEGFALGQRLECCFGGDKVDGVILSAQQMECPIPLNVVIKCAVTALVNGVNVPFAKDANFEFVEDASVTDISPILVPYTSGDVIDVSGIGFFLNGGYLCQFGDIIAEAAMVISSTNMKCPTPLLTQAQTVSLSIIDGSGRQLAQSFDVTFVAPVYIISSDRTALATDGSDGLVLFGEGFVPGVEVVCIFGSYSAPGSAENENIISCATPVVPASDSVAVQIMLGGYLCADSAVTISFAQRPVVSSVSLSTLDLHVSNKAHVFGEFSNGTIYCRFADEFVNATFVSDAEVVCESPAIEQCDTMFSVEINGVESFPQILPCNGLPVVISVQPAAITTGGQVTFEVIFDEALSTGLDFACSMFDIVAPLLQLDGSGSYACSFTVNEDISIKSAELTIYAGDVSIFKTSTSLQQDINTVYSVTPSVVMADQPVVLRISGIFDMSTPCFCLLDNTTSIQAVMINYREIQCVFTAAATTGTTQLKVSSSSSVIAELTFEVVTMPVIVSTQLGVSVSSNWLEISLQEPFTDSVPLYCQFGTDKVLTSKNGLQTYWCAISSQLACSGGEVRVLTNDEYVLSSVTLFTGSLSSCTVNDVAMVWRPVALYENETETYQYGTAVAEFSELPWTYQPMQIPLPDEKLFQSRFTDSSGEVLAGENYFSAFVGKIVGNSSLPNLANNSSIAFEGYGSNLVVSITNYSPKIVDTINGTWVFVSGRNFDRTAQCVVGNLSTRTFVYSSTNLTCFIPPAVISKPLTIVFLSVRNGEHAAWSQSVVLWHDVMLGKRFTTGSSFRLDTSINEISYSTSGASADAVCLLSEGCDISVSYLTAQLNQEGSFQNEDCSELDVSAAQEEAQAEVYYADRRVLMSSCSDCFISFVGENLQSTAPICLVLDNATITCSNSLTTPDIELWCKLPDIIPPGNMTLKLLNANCTLQLYSTTVQVALPTTSSKNEWEGKLSSNALVSSEIIEVNPSIASMSGGVHISIFGRGLSNVVAVAMTGTNGKKYYTEVDVVLANELQLISPTVQGSDWFTFTLILPDRSSIATSARVKFVAPLQIFDAFEVVLSSEVHALSIQGQDFTSVKQVTCLIQAYNGSLYTTSAQIFDQGHLFCSVPAKLHLEGAKCSISFNGIEYSNQVDIALSNSVDSVSLQLESSYHVVEFPGYKNASDFSTVHFVKLDPISLTKCCSAVMYLPFTVLETSRSVGSYNCDVDGQITGQAFFTATRTAICSLPSQLPGNYVVRLVDEWGSIAAREYSIICAPPPHVNSVEIMPKYDAVKTAFAVTGRYLVESDDFVCAYGSILVKVTVSTSSNAVCIFKNLPTSNQAANFAVIANGVSIFSNEICLTEALLYDGGLLTDEQCTSKVEFKAEQDTTLATVLRIRSITPRMGLTNGQTIVRIAVEGLTTLSKLTCQFDQVTTSASRIDEETVVCRTPPHIPGNVTVSLSDSITGLYWCCDWFYYNPPLLTTSYFPTRINANIGGMILLQVRNLDTSGLILYCHMNNLIEIAMRINDSTIACSVPQVYTKVVNISIGSYTEKWSNPIIVTAESTSATLWPFFPSFGSTNGNTTITISIPSGLLLSDPYCLIDNRLIVPANKTASAITCTTLPSQISVVEVNIRDGAESSNPTYYVGTYTYLPSTEVFRSDPATYEQGKDVDVTVFGLHFLDSTDLVCIVNGEIVIRARWLSTSMLKCKILFKDVGGDNSLQLAVSNNRLDYSDTVTIVTVAPYEIESVYPLAGFVVGGNDVIIMLTFPSTERFSCIFGGIRTRAILIEADRVVCEAPAHNAGDITLTMTTHNGVIIGEVQYTYLPMPVLGSDASQAVVVTLPSRVAFQVTRNVPPMLYGRFRDINGVLIKSAGCLLVGEELVCDAVIASEANVYLTLDISLDGDFFISNAGSVQVFPCLNVLWTDPLSVADTGGDTLEFGFEQDRVLSSVLCVFKSDGSIVKSDQAIVLDASTTGSCTAPVLDADSINTIELQQFGSIIFGPSYLVVYPRAVVESVFPMRVYTGVPQTLSLTFETPVKSYPIPHVEILGNVYPITLLDGYHGVVTVYASASSSAKVELLLTYPSITTSKTLIIVLDVIDYIDDVVVNTQPIVQGVLTNYTYTSSTCNLDENVYCKVSAGDVIMMHTTEGCNMTCSVIVIQQSVDEERLTISLCGGDTCNTPLRVDYFDILSPVVAVQAVPLFGSVLGGPMIKILGNGFQPDASLECIFGTQRSSATFISSTELKCTLPANAPGAVNISIGRRGVVISTNLAEFDYLPVMSILSIEPKFLAMLGGTAVTVLVQEYLNSSLIQYCRFNEIYTLAIVELNKQVTCEAPALNVQEVSFALAAGRENDFTVPVTLQVRSPLYPVFLDPTVVTEGQVGDIHVYFDSAIQEMQDIVCNIDDEQMEVSFSPEMITCHHPALTSGIKSFQLSLDQIMFFKTTIEVRPAFSILTVWPQAAFIDQVTAVEITVAGEGYGESSVHCCFGPYQSPAALLAYNKWQCYSPKINQGGVNVVQKLPVGLAIGSNFCDMSILDFSLYPPFKIVNQTGSNSGTIFGGDTVILQTVEYYYPPTVYCRFGTTVIVGQFVENVGVICLTPPTPRGIVSVDLSVNGIEFQPSGAVFDFFMPDYDYYNTPTGEGYINNQIAGDFRVDGFVDPSSSITSLSGAVGNNDAPTASSQPLLFALSGSSFPSSSQFNVILTGRNFVVDSVCKLGSGAVLTTTYISSTQLRCDFPVVAAGNDSIYVQNANGAVSSSQPVQFVASPVVGSVTGMTVSPSFGPRNAQTLLTVSVMGLNAATNYYCLIGEDWVPAFNATNTTLNCLAPPNSIVGQVNVRVGTPDPVVLSGNGYFEYLDDPIVLDIQPKRATAYSTVIIFGLGFTRFPSLSLNIGDNVAPCTTLSNTRLICTIPNITANTYQVFMTANGQHLVQTGLEYTQFTPTTLTSLWPFNGPALRGQTVLSVYGSNIPLTIDVFCIIDTATVPANVLSAELAQCRVPPHELGIVNVSLVADGIFLHPPEQNLQYAYVPDVSVVQLEPANGYTAGEFPIMVFGSNFVNTSSLGCRFADINSRAIFVSTTTLVCLSPSTLGRPELATPTAIPVEVTVNGYDYSESNVLFAYSEPCDQGFFCPGLTRALCPNGTYCPPNSRNFTLCPTGTFQPLQGQTSCDLCPVGYLCPDIGLPRPIQCPNGLICDSMGLTASAKLCPAGSYCLNTTKASTPDDFIGLIGWVVNNVTGVVSFNSSEFNYSYSSYPAPAVGKSRPQAPPESSCDGQVCQGGSTAVLAEAPFPCPIGHYCRVGAGTQIPIPKNFSSPQRCFDGFFCPRGSVSPEGAGPCPNGYYCPTQLDAMVCPAGTYCAGVGNTAPVECYPGTYNPFTGRANCTVCPSGYICPGWGLLLPELCPEGFVCTALGLSYPVVTCPGGYRCGEGTLALDPSDTTIFKPKVCKAGQFCLGGVSSPINIEWVSTQPWGTTHPQLCSEGTYCQAGAYLSSGSGLCFQGHYCPPNSSFPIATPVGNFASGLGAVAPTLCYPGTYAPLQAQVTCDTCPSGFTCQSYGSYIPTICGKGTYRSQVDSLTCVNCPTGTYSYETGAPDLSLCLPCPQGAVCPIVQLTTFASSSICPSGYICGAGTDLSQQFLHLTPAGFSSSTSTIPTAQYDAPCSAGYYCRRGTPTAQNTAGKCTVGAFCPQSTPVSPSSEILCPDYTTSPTQTVEVTGCIIDPTPVCSKELNLKTNPLEDLHYYSSFTYTTLDDSMTVETLDSSLSTTSPTGELQVVTTIHPLNKTGSTPTWLNDTIEAFRACPLYGNANGGDVITIIGRNFRDTDLNFCRFRPCLSSNLGVHLRRCKNQVNSATGVSLDIAGNVSNQAFITKAKFISNTRLECTTPQYIFDNSDANFNPTFAVNNYICAYVDAFGDYNSNGNYSYVRPCDTVAGTVCLNKPAVGYEYFSRVYFPCTTTEVLNSICSNYPRLEYMMNPCMSGEVAVEVTNDGENYSGGDDLHGQFFVSTIRYYDPSATIYDHFKNFTRNATFAVFTMIMPEYFPTNALILQSDIAHCQLPLYVEEAQRPRENDIYMLKLMEIAVISIDLTFLPDDFVYGQHYEIAIYVRPSRCDSNFCNSAGVQLPPEEYVPCQSPIPFSYWFSQTTIPKNIVNNITLWALDDALFQVEIQILYGLHAAYAPLFYNTTTVTIISPSRASSIVGLPLGQINTRPLTPYVSYTMQQVPQLWFFCAVVYQSDSGSLYSPLNLPPLYSAYAEGRVLVMNNVTDNNPNVSLVLDPFASLDVGVSFWMMPATTPDESKEQLDAYFETFQYTTYQAGSGYTFAFDTLVIPYFPYFSNCYGFDSYIPIWYVTENEQLCSLPNSYPKNWERYKYPPLPSQDDIRFVGPFDFFSQPISDWCEVSLSCNYEEQLSSAEATARWFELPSSSTVFSLIRFPLDYKQYTGRQNITVSQNDEGGAAYAKYLATISTDNFIHVKVSKPTASSACSIQCFARSWTLTIEYYQVDNYNKKLIIASLGGTNFDFDSTNTNYNLNINFFGLGFLDLILNFSFELPIFIVIYCFLGLLSLTLAFMGWIVNRMTTLLQNPPQLRMFSMIALIVPPAMAGVSIAAVLIWFMTAMANYFIFGVFVDDPASPTEIPIALRSQYIDQYPLTYNNLGGSKVSDSQAEIQRYGRMGLAFFVIGFCCFHAASKMYFPRPESKRELEIAQRRTPLAKKRELWQPVMWKKLNFIFASFMLGTILYLAVQLSYWGSFGTFYYQIIVIYVLLGEGMRYFASRQLNDAILIAPLSAAWVFVQSLISFGSPNFLVFILQNYSDFAITTFQRVFQKYYADLFTEGFRIVSRNLRVILRLIVPKYLHGRVFGNTPQMTSEEERDYRKRAVEGVALKDEENESVEPILEYFGDVCCDTIMTIYFPFVVYLLMQYRLTIYIPITYNIRQSDMIIYLFYQLFLLLFQPIVDVFNHSQCELFWGWKIYEYLVYSRYRFLQRETRWKGMENTLDECIEESLRRLDQMCFSSQYFLMLTIQTNGIVYVILAYQVWIHYNYSPFSDPALLFVAGYIWAVYMAFTWVVMFLAVRLKVWRIKHENTAWHTVQEEEDELDIPAWEEIKGASSEAFLLNQRITSETFRYKFLNYNRTWLINQLPLILTPRTLRRSRPYLINQFQRIINARRDNISDDDDDEQQQVKFGPVALTAPSRNIVRWWLGRARRRMRLRTIVEPLIKRARGSQCEICLSRKQLQVEYEVDLDTMTGMYDKSFPGDEEVDQVQWKTFWTNNQRYHTICLACVTERKAKAARDAYSKGALDPSIFDDDNQEDYPDWGPVFLSAASKAILLNWYRKAQKLRAGKRKQRVKKERVTKDISDDEGDDPAFSWLKEGLRNVTPATKAIAIRWMRSARARLQQKRGKGSGLRERDVFQEEQVGEGFRSGLKSKMLRK